MPTSEDMRILANECLNCKNPFCVEGCPAHTDIPTFVAKLKSGKGEEAVDVLLQTNPLGLICSYVCPRYLQCEGHCVKQKLGKAVSIGKLERYAFDRYFTSYKKYDDSLCGKAVAVIGSGPSGLSAAYGLKRCGADVTVYDKHNSCGGVLNYGIPSFRLDKAHLNKVVCALKDFGIRFVFGTEIGKDITLSELQRKYSAVYLACGLQSDKPMGSEGETAEGVYLGNAYLKNPEALGRVAVIGGGNVAMDCARTAASMGDDVTVYYRRTYEQLPAYEDEKQSALREGVKFEYLLAPKSVKRGNSLQITFDVMSLCGEGSDGRKSVRKTGETLTAECDAVIAAIGSTADSSVLFGSGISFENGLLKTDGNGYTGYGNLFAGGDIANNENTVVAAVRDGMNAAKAIANFIKKQN
ncbi:MAG: FAD-dependent oxidoreductase [Corallococcus sp.]|nr:FAD-dependent oxidoreductase [Corallococcus sp.]